MDPWVAIAGAGGAASAGQGWNGAELARGYSLPTEAERHYDGGLQPPKKNGWRLDTQRWMPEAPIGTWLNEVAPSIVAEDKVSTSSEPINPDEWAGHLGCHALTWTTTFVATCQRMVDGELKLGYMTCYTQYRQNRKIAMVYDEEEHRYYLGCTSDGEPDVVGAGCDACQAGILA